MFRLLLLIALGSNAGTLLGADWAVDPGSQLRFVGSAQGESFSGEFKQFSAMIRFDPDDLAGSRFEVDIELGSADSANSERDELLRSAEFFAVEQNPQAHYIAERFTAEDDGSYRAEGQLQLKAEQRPVTLRFRWTREGASAILDGEAEIDRLDFAIGGGDWADTEMIAAKVKVSTQLKLSAR